MRFLIAPDSFKECMTSIEAADAIREGITEVFENAEFDLVPMGDGGEGTADCVINSFQDSKKVFCRAKAASGQDVWAYFVYIANGKKAVVEVSNSIGLMLVPEEKRIPLKFSSYGAGQVVSMALKTGCKEIVIALGGSATNDGGIGFLQALGGIFKDKDGNILSSEASVLSKVYSADLKNVREKLEDIKIILLCDVDNILLGKNGATYVFGPQKGVTEQMLQPLDEAMKNYADVVEHEANKKIRSVPGSGAAGGLGFAIMSVSEPEKYRGIEYMLRLTKFEDRLKCCDYVITGEGSLDRQTLSGKLPVGIGNISAKYEKPVIVFAGRVEQGIKDVYESGISAVVSIWRQGETQKDAIRNGKKNLSESAEMVARIIKTAYHLE